MKWFVLVFFASYSPDGSRATFVFNNPTYSTETECRWTLTNKQHIMNYVNTMMIAYEGKLPGRVEKVNCIDQNAYNELMKLKKYQDSTREDV